MGKQILCAICLTDGDIETMRPVDDFFRCQKCGTEVWPKNMDYVKQWKKREKEEANNNYVSRSLPEGVHVHGGDKKQGKSSLKDKMTKQPISKLNYMLYKDT